MKFTWSSQYKDMPSANDNSEYMCVRGKYNSELYQTFGARSSMVLPIFSAEERNGE